MYYFCLTIFNSGLFHKKEKRVSILKCIDLCNVSKLYMYFYTIKDLRQFCLSNSVGSDITKSMMQSNKIAIKA